MLHVFTILLNRLSILLNRYYAKEQAKILLKSLEYSFSAPYNVWVGANAYGCITSEHGYKFSKDKKTILKEYNSYCQLEKESPELSSFAPLVSFRKVNTFFVLCMEKLLECPDPSIKSLLKIACIAKKKWCFTHSNISEHHLIQLGLSSLYKVASPEQQNIIRNKVDIFTLRKHYLGIIHGDLHPGNIMQSKKGRLKIIDWDYCHFDEYCIIDALNYMNAQAMEQQKRSWYDVLGTMKKNIESNISIISKCYQEPENFVDDSLVIFVAFKLGQSVDFYSTIKDSAIKKIVDNMILVLQDCA